MSAKVIKAMGRASIFLALASAALFAIPAWAQISDAVKAASEAADIARQKDIVWLALIVAIVSMVISALKDYWIGRSVYGLREDLAKRPCFHVEPKEDRSK